MHNLGVAEQHLGDWQAAARAYERAFQLDPGAFESGFSLAIALAVIGEVAQAIDVYRELARQPRNAPRALTRIAALRAQELTDEDILTLELTVRSGAAAMDERVGCLFAIGAALDLRGGGEDAFQAFASANGLKYELLTKGPVETRPATVAGDHELSVARVTALFTKGFLTRHDGGGEKRHQPVFIIGMPRSGTTLIEHVLSAHPRVRGMGESDALALAVEGRFPYPPDGPREPDHFAAIARRYLNRQSARGCPPRARIVDKTLDNHLNVGLIHLTFPKSVILWVRRSRNDVIWSCYRQHFASGNETLYNLTDIGAECDRYDRMMAHWRDVLPGRVIEIAYEAFVATPEASIRQLVVEHCGLPWSSACLDFHAHDRAITTASAEQVRRPVGQDSVGAWRRYASQLTPILGEPSSG